MLRADHPLVPLPAEGELRRHPRFVRRLEVVQVGGQQLDGGGARLRDTPTNRGGSFGGVLLKLPSVCAPNPGGRHHRHLVERVRKPPVRRRPKLSQVSGHVGLESRDSMEPPVERRVPTHQVVHDAHPEEGIRRERLMQPRIREVEPLRQEHPTQHAGLETLAAVESPGLRRIKRLELTIDPRDAPLCGGRGVVRQAAVVPVQPRRRGQGRMELPAVPKDVGRERREGGRALSHRHSPARGWRLGSKGCVPNP